MYDDWFKTEDLIWKTYEKQIDLGKGAQGNVIKVFHKSDRAYYSMKTVDINFNSKTNCLNVLREIKILKNLHHRNIIGLKEVIINESIDHYKEILLVTDLMDIDLKNVIYSSQELTMPHVKKIAFQIITALEYLHRKKVMHRDIKPANILVNKDCKVKLCDFGMAKPNLHDLQFEGRSFPLNSCNVTTRWYRAPEILFEFQDYNESSDVWSFGCVLAEMLKRKPFLKGHTEVEQIELIADLIGNPPQYIMDKMSPKFKDLFEEEIDLPKNFKKLFLMLENDGIDLLQNIFTYDYESRISAKEIMNHPFFKEEAESMQDLLQDALDLVDDEELDTRLFAFETKDFKQQNYRKLIYSEKGEFW